MVLYITENELPSFLQKRSAEAEQIARRARDRISELTDGDPWELILPEPNVGSPSARLDFRVPGKG